MGCYSSCWLTAGTSPWAARSHCSPSAPAPTGDGDGAPEYTMVGRPGGQTRGALSLSAFRPVPCTSRQRASCSCRTRIGVPRQRLSQTVTAQKPAVARRTGVVPRTGSSAPASCVHVAAALACMVFCSAASRPV